MSLAVLYSRALSGMEAELVTVEVHLAGGLPSFTIVGLPETDVIIRSGTLYEYPNSKYYKHFYSHIARQH